ncbi:hypothetical protein Pfo_026122 [Paulownia fortunei]|nr:hypothetical protein Pfo_026122 [Paulownia fortunei]
MKSTEGDRNSLANELIVKALKMGVNDLNFEFHPPSLAFVLPHEVLGAETLIRLSVIGCKVARRVDGKVGCLRLKSLSLCRVFIGDDVVWDIISSCPLIEKLLLSECECLIDIKKSTVARKVTKILALRSPSIEFGKQNVGSVVDGLIKLSEFHKLKCLLLDRVHIDSLFFRDFSLKFPCLEDLTLRYCYGYKGIKISSPSLECISLAQTRMLRAKFDVPSIRKFKFSGSSFPSLSLTTVAREWESDIPMTCSRYHLSASWFLELKKFLTKLSLSKISISIGFFLEKRIDFVGDIQGLPKPVVENLTLSMHSPSSVCSALLDGLFWSCRPKVITQYWFPRSCIAEKANNDFLELLCKTLIQQASQNCCIPNQNMFGLRDLEEVNVEFFEEILTEWRPLPWKTLLDASTSPENSRKIRFQLKWGLEPITFI